ncbi:hypothetical protein DFH06DRAFT_1121798 [Mycena polygramma]|nr:hypothetical protein DFH06DRAFT_1121798 [Mycena polygramma]
MTQPNSAGRMRGVQEQIRSGSESSEGKETREEQREVATGSTGAEQKLKSSAEGVTQAQMIWTRVGGWNVHEERETRRWTEQSSEGVVEPWEVSARGNDQSSEDPNKSREVEQLGRAGRNGQTELRNDAADLYGFKAVTQPTSCSNTPEVFGTKAEPRPRVPRGICREGEGSGNGKHRRCRPKAGAITQPANCSSTREMSGTERTETECSEGNFAKSCEGNRRRAPKIAGGANRGLEGSPERDSRLKRSLGDARPKGDRNPEEPEDGREVLINSRERPNEIPDSTEPRSRTAKCRDANRYGRETGEDVWDFGKDVRAPERPDSFSGASLGNRKSQNTIRTSVRGELTGRYRVKAERQRKGSGTSRSDRINRKVRVEAQGRRRGMSGSGGPAERNQVNPMVRNELQKSEGRGEEPRDSGDKMPEVSETTEMEERKCRGIRDLKSRRPEQIKGVRLSSLRLREEWKGGKEVVNDPDRSRSRSRAEERRGPEISRADGEVARADRSTEGQRPEVVRTEVGGRPGGEPELLKYGEASDQKGKEKENMRMRQKERRTIRTDKRKYTRSEDLGAAESAGLIGIGGGIVGDDLIIGKQESSGASKQGN